MIINTHTHGDHVSGNVEFPATVDIVVQENTAGQHGEDEPGAGLRRSQPARTSSSRTGRGMPKRTFKDQMTIGKGADQIDLLLLRPRPHERRRVGAVPGAAHRARRRHLRRKNLPLLDANNGGSGVEIADTLMKAHGALIKSADMIITGHSTQMTMNDLREWADFNREFLNAGPGREEGRADRRAIRDDVEDAGQFPGGGE